MHKSAYMCMYKSEQKRKNTAYVKTSNYPPVLLHSKSPRAKNGKHVAVNPYIDRDSADSVICNIRIATSSQCHQIILISLYLL